MKKYEIIKKCAKIIDGKTLYPIRALVDIPRKNVHAGDLGGFVESEANLSHKGSCWIFEDADVYENATVTEHAEVCGLARVHGHAKVAGHARVGSRAEVYEHALVTGSSYITDFAKVRGWAITSGTSCVFEHAEVCGSSSIFDEAEVCGHAKILGHTRLYGSVRAGGTFVSPEYAFLASGTLNNSDEVIAIDGLPDLLFPSMGYNAVSGDCWLGDITIPHSELIEQIADQDLSVKCRSIYFARAEELLRMAKERTKKEE